MNEILEWKQHPVTQEFLHELKKRIEGLKDEIVSGTLDADPRLLAYKAGAICAMNDILDLDF